ncbi:phospholipase D family protein [Planococcus lenghuensis]|uniref:Phospholipase n=1 Tax=Planococcus lenghuensis TaxID=2213202 RepID=A0A1Q2L1M5_9BACL|nr:phospholipase D family protein [Planococcus lenghuensis]AQQ54360.1 phospholipase [Planococcus lenghuensis]
MKAKLTDGRKWLTGTLSVLAVSYVAAAAWNSFIKPIPKGLAYQGRLHRAETIDMLTDLTYVEDREGKRTKREAQIFQEIYQVIDRAEQFIVLDFFMLGRYGAEGKEYPAIAENLVSRLLAKKEASPDMPIYFITDPLNSGYGSYELPEFSKLKEAGVEVIYTDLDKLRDSIPLYSGLYRLLVQWPDNGGEGWISNPIAGDAPDMTLSSFLTLLNIKANHRKAIITESEAIISSANPHDPDGYNDNMAFRVTGPVLKDLLEAEEAVSLMSGGPVLPRTEPGEERGEYKVQYLTEHEVLKALLQDITATEEGDAIWLAMLYLAEREVINALKSAAKRGVDVRLILDPNKTAFGRNQRGLPNRPVAKELRETGLENLQLRWYNVIDEEFHTKTTLVRMAGKTVISGGSSNFSSRSLDNHNIESNLRIEAPNDSDLVQSLEAYFKRLWNNEDGIFTLDDTAYQSRLTPLERGVYAVQKLLKITTY